MERDFLNGLGRNRTGTRDVQLLIEKQVLATGGKIGIQSRKEEQAKEVFQEKVKEYSTKRIFDVEWWEAE